MVLPSLLLVLAVLLGGVTVAAAQLACTDAARVGARALARGETDHRARELALSAAPAAADVRLVREAGMARVTVRADLRLGPAVGSPVVVVGNAAVPWEPGV